MKIKALIHLLLFSVCVESHAFILWHFEFTGEDFSSGGTNVSGAIETNGNIDLALGKSAGISPFFSSYYTSDTANGARGLIYLRIDDQVISDSSGIGTQNHYSTIDWSHPNQEVNEGYLPYVTNISPSSLSLYHNRSFGAEEVSLYSSDLSLHISDLDSSTLVFSIIPESSESTLIFGMVIAFVISIRRKM